MRTKILLIAIFSLVFILPGNSQYKITNYSDMNQINNLVEDGDYIWVCTSGGAFKRKKSDGSIVTVFNTANSGISRDRVESMYIDFHGNYWFGTNWGGISRFDGTNWMTIREVGGFTISDCKTITEDINGNIWFGLNSGMVVKYDGTDWELIDLTGAWYVGSILSDDLGNMWFGVPGIHGSLWKMDPEGNIVQIHDDFGYIESGGAYDIAKDLHGNIWITSYSGAMKYNPYADTWTDYSSELPPNVYSIAQDGAGNLWFGTGFGAYKFDGTSWTSYLSGESGDRIDMVLDLMADANGNIWLGSYNGLAKVDQVNGGWTPRIEMNTVQSNYVEAIGFLSDGSARMMGQYSYVIGYENDYFREFSASGGCGYGWIKHLAIDQNDNTWISFLGYSDHILKVIKIDSDDNATCWNISNYLDADWPSNYVNDVTFDRDNNIFWIATPDGLFLFNANNNYYNHATMSNSALPDNYISGVTTKGDNKIWFTTSTSGLGYLNYSNFSGENYTTEDGLPSNSCSGLTTDSDENIWLISSNNLSKFEKNTFTNYTAPSFYTTIETDNKGNVWLGHSAGGAKFNGSEFTTFTVKDGLNESIVNNIAIDADNNAWFASGYFGISKITTIAAEPNFETPVTCLPGETQLTNTSNAVDNLSRYEWDIDNDGTVDYTTKDFNHSFTSQGEYTIKLTVYNDDISAEIIQTIKVLESPQVSLTPSGTNYICIGNNQQISAELLNYDPYLNYTFEWNNGLTRKEIYTDTSGIFYINVSNGDCVTQSMETEIIASEPFAEAKICMVSVDSADQKNMVIWERTPDAGIQSYNIYKLYGTSYVPIGNVPYDSKYSYFIDYQSNPEALAARYAITVIDTCGNESDFSPYHQTIHLGTSLGVEPNTYVLDWTSYEDESGIWEPELYYCLAGPTPDRMEEVFSISSSFTEWNDTDPGDRVYYQIEVRKANACFVTLADGKKGESGPFIHSFSNLEDNRIKTGILDSEANIITAYPNPMENWCTIDIADNKKYPLEVKIRDINGRIVRITEYFENHIIIERDDLKSGFYFIEIVSDKKYTGKLMVK